VFQPRGREAPRRGRGQSGGERFVAQLLADPAHSVFNLYDSTLFAIGPALLVLGPYAHKTDREIPIVLLTEQNPPRRRNA
jgi:hypothetical protein